MIKKVTLNEPLKLHVTFLDLSSLPYPRKKAPGFIHGDELRSRSRFSHLSGLNAIA